MEPRGRFLVFLYVFLAREFDLTVFFTGVENPNDPFNYDAYPNSWTPPLNTTWTWGKDKVYGSVPLGDALTANSSYGT